jgi:transcriptional regulator with XRE-family HTH domain
VTVLNEVLRRYRSYDPETGEFNVRRGVREYARLLGVNDGQLSQILNDIQRPGIGTLQALARTFPAAAPEIAAALAGQPLPERELAQVPA